MKKDGIKVVVCGAAGRMGHAVLDCFGAADDVDVISGVDKVGSKYGDVAIGTDLSAVIGAADCVVDFSNTAFMDELASLCDKKKKPLVSGTTGLSTDSMKLIEGTSKRVAVVLSPNMSPGMNVLFRITSDVAGVLGDQFDISIVETHHRWKKDSPSGTARKLSGLIEDVSSKEPQVRSLRIGDIVGEHTVTFAGEGEKFELTHRAHSRKAFAFGALLAVRFAVKASPGLYDMSDVLGLR